MVCITTFNSFFCLIGGEPKYEEKTKDLTQVADMFYYLV